MDAEDYIEQLQLCSHLAAQEKCKDFHRIVKMECAICRYAKAHKTTYLKAAIDLCDHNDEDNICLIGAACLLTQLKN